MSCLGREYSTSSWQTLRHHFEFSQLQETPPLPPPPCQRAYDNNYYTAEASSTKQRTPHVLKPTEAFEKTKVLRETSIEWPKAGTSGFHAEPPRSVPTEVHNDFNQVFGCQPFVGPACCCAYPCCETPSVYQRNFASTYNTKRAYLHQLQALNSVLLPNIARMAYERKKWNGERSTKEYEAAVASKCGKILSSGISGERKESQAIRKSNLEVNAEDKRAEKSAFVKARSTRKTTNIESRDVFKQFPAGSSEQKRKLETFYERETHEDIKSKRLKFESSRIPNMNNTNDSRHDFRPNVHTDKRINYPSLRKDLSCMPNGYPTVVTKGLGLFGLQSQNAVSSKGFVYETKTLSSLAHDRSDDVGLESYDTRVNEGGKIRHHGQPSPTERSRLALDTAETSQAVESRQQFTNDTSGFISLDSTKSSFLTLINKIRQTSTDDVIACPYCWQTFTKYPDLRNHVQTHIDTRTSAGHSVADVRGQKGESLSPGNGRQMTAPGLFAAVQNTGDEAKKRATSVIMFAGQKKE